MKRRLILICLSFILLIASFTLGYADELDINIDIEKEENDYKPQTVEEAVNLANKEIEEKYGESNYYDVTKVNKEIWKKYGAIVYGEPHGDAKGDMQRYIGYTRDGIPFGNPEFPRDDWTGGTFDERNWRSSIAKPVITVVALDKNGFDDWVESFEISIDYANENSFDKLFHIKHNGKELEKYLVPFDNGNSKIVIQDYK